MKNLSLLILIIILHHLTSYSQGCLPQGILFYQQIDIDNFQINHPGCTEIAGDVHIQGPAITNLNGLNTITKIGGYLILNNCDSIHSLAALANLQYIGTDLLIGSCDGLHNLVGLNALTHIGRALNIDTNHNLDNLTGLGPIDSLKFLFIKYNEKLTSLSSLAPLTSIGDDLTIRENQILSDLTGLNNLTRIGGSFHLEMNLELTTVSALQSLASIGSELNIVFNSKLANLTGLDSLNSIGGELLINSNLLLVDLTGLSNIASTSIAGIKIIDNTNLSSCAVRSICDYLASPGSIVEISNNENGCNSQEEVEKECRSLMISEKKPKFDFTI